MTTPAPPEPRPSVVVGVDGSEPGYVALQRAAEVSNVMGSTLYVVHVRHIPAWWSLAAVGAVALPETLEQILDRTEQQVRDRAEIILHDHAHWSFEAVSGDPVDQLMAAAERHGAIAIVVGGKGHRPASPLILGSVAAGLVHRSTVSVMIVRPPHPKDQQPERP